MIQKFDATIPIPLGRHQATFEELKASGITDSTSVRSEIWSGFELIFDAVHEAVGEIAACWIGGSYLSDKPNPSDLDCVFIIDQELLLRARSDPEKRTLLAMIANSEAKYRLQLKVDTYILEWHPQHGVDEGDSRRKEYYLQVRGFYDDLFARSRAGSQRSQSIPVQGYLEVIVDGYK